MQPASAKWYDRRDSVFVEFCVEDSKDVQVNFEKSKFGFSCLNGADNVKLQNTVDLFGEIDPDGSKHRRTDRSVLCCLRKAEAGKSWPRLTKEKTKCNWLSVDFNNWKDWEDDSDEDLSSFDKFSEVRIQTCTLQKHVSMSKCTVMSISWFCAFLQMMNSMGGDDLPDLDAAEEEHDSADSDDEKMPDLE
ncbi:prostaglandin E synthase 3 isoform X1 [Cheilinus undulatus]|uniref:prostaglandin E synthase 3 isoform X1 n=1 Tax=Cheilinus undulatus TaxID=241271 RepID=UPI001BD20487|nr:prostaglandin E synthase 3 isoform X1 [Cheilinus undulatus]